MTLALLTNFRPFIGPTSLSQTFDWLINHMVSGNRRHRSRYIYFHNGIITCSYLGLLILPCTHTEGPRSPRPVGLFTLNHRVFRTFVGDRRPSSRTVVPRPGPSLLISDRRPSSRTVVPRSRPSSLVPDRRPSSFDPLWHIYSYPTLRLSSLCLSIYHTLPSFGERTLTYSCIICNREIPLV